MLFPELKPITFKSYDAPLNLEYIIWNVNTINVLFLSSTCYKAPNTYLQQ